MPHVTMAGERSHEPRARGVVRSACRDVSRFAGGNQLILGCFVAVLIAFASITGASDQQFLGRSTEGAIAVGLGSATGEPRVVRLPAPDARVRVIVEFDALPLAKASNRMRAAAVHRDLRERFRNDLSLLDASNAKAASSTIRHEYLRTFTGAAVAADEVVVRQLRELPYVLRVMPDNEARASVEPGIAAIRADQVWTAHGTRGDGVIVAVLDSGIDYLHPALGGGFGDAFKVESGWDFVNADADPMDDFGHGTHVAGIIAADSPELEGVAPGARLIAFKVLDETGAGLMSDVIAAIERTVDLDGDLDLSDRADVANVSLGGPPLPDDPVAAAVDNAVSMGVVFCVAAGNAGAWQSIGSPGTAEGAITVGASGNDGALATFSSRGPAAHSYRIKPDLLAPGVAIRSAEAGGDTITHDGTSMATPHVAGVAALLRALHPDWSADQIRSAIVTTATPLPLGVMEAGSGMVDALRAAGATTWVSPTSLNFGRIDPADSSWSSRIAMTVRNESQEQRNYVLRAAGAPPGLTLAFDSPTFSLPPGGSVEVAVTASADGTTLPFPGESLAHGGTVVVVDGRDEARIPWAAIQGVRLSISYSGDEWVFTIVAPTDGSQALLFDRAGDSAVDALFPPGEVDAMIVSTPLDGATTAILALEKITLLEDRTFSTSYADAAHTLDTLVFDEEGVELPRGLPGTGCEQERYVFMPGDHTTFVAAIGATPALRTNTLSERFTILGSELCFRRTPGRIHALQYAPLRGMSSSVILTAGGPGLARQAVELRFPPRRATELTLTNRVHTMDNPLFLDLSTSFRMPENASSWRGVLHFDDPKDGSIGFRPSIGSWSLGAVDSVGTVSRHFRRTAQGVGTFDSPTPPPTTQLARPGEALVFGAGPAFPLATFGGYPSVVVTAELRGPLDEARYLPDMRMTLRSADGSTVAEGYREIRIPDVRQGGTLEIAATVPALFGQVSSMRAVYAFGNNAFDPNPPTLTSIAFLDASGHRLTDRVAMGSTPRIRFSARDRNDEPAVVRLRHRPHGGDAWTEALVEIVGRNYGTRDHPPAGTIYEADLGAIASEPVAHDIEIFLEHGGDTMTFAISPAIGVTDGRQRPVRR